MHYTAVIRDVTETLRDANIQDPTKTVDDYVRESEVATSTYLKLSEIVGAGDREARETRAQHLIAQFGAAAAMPTAPDAQDAFDAELARRLDALQ